MEVGKDINVLKFDIHGRETWRYQGTILDKDDDRIVIRAYFDLEDSSFHGMDLSQGDLFIEYYFYNRWYNIFEIRYPDSKDLKGWYCNISTPAETISGDLHYTDLALDLLVFPDGKQTVLDMDEFEQLEVNESIRKQALKALDELTSLFHRSEVKNYSTGFFT